MFMLVFWIVLLCRLIGRYRVPSSHWCLPASLQGIRPTWIRIDEKLVLKSNSGSISHFHDGIDVVDWFGDIDIVVE